MFISSSLSPFVEISFQDHIRQFLSDKQLRLNRNHPTNYHDALQTLAQPADHSEVLSFTNRSIDWPGPARISWDDPLGSPWNKQAISVLVLEFSEVVHNCHYSKLRVLPPFASIPWLSAEVEKRLEKTRSRLRKLLRPLAHNETSEEQSKRLQDEATLSAIQSRRRERRNKVSASSSFVIYRPLTRSLPCSASTAESPPSKPGLFKMKLATGPMFPKYSNISPKMTCPRTRQRLRRAFKPTNEPGE
jgi:hypothetical protein